MKPVTDEKMMKIIREAWANYGGHLGDDCSVLMSAIGALVFGREVGWKGIRVCMSASTFRKYEKILGIRFRDVVPERTSESTRIVGIQMADAFGKFWQALSGGLIPAQKGKIADPAT
jgi:hypothetical protein